MDYLQSFSIRDFLIFSPESYFKLFELSNQSLWPLQIPIILSAVVAIFLLYKRYHFSSKAICLWLGMVWAFVGYWYFTLYYSQINTFAHIAAYFFWAEAFLFFLVAIFANHRLNLNQGGRVYLAGSFIVYGMLIHPWISLLLWDQAISRLELFSIAPDPTAIITIGFILLLPFKGAFLLLIIPSLWLLSSLMTYQAF